MHCIEMNITSKLNNELELVRGCIYGVMLCLDRNQWLIQCNKYIPHFDHQPHIYIYDLPPSEMILWNCKLLELASVKVKRLLTLPPPEVEGRHTDHHITTNARFYKVDCGNKLTVLARPIGGQLSKQTPNIR